MGKRFEDLQADSRVTEFDQELTRRAVVWSIGAGASMAYLGLRELFGKGAMRDSRPDIPGPAIADDATVEPISSITPTPQPQPEKSS